MFALEELTLPTRRPRQTARWSTAATDCALTDDAGTVVATGASGEVVVDTSDTAVSLACDNGTKRTTTVHHGPFVTFDRALADDTLTLKPRVVQYVERCELHTEFVDGRVAVEDVNVDVGSDFDVSVIDVFAVTVRCFDPFGALTDARFDRTPPTLSLDADNPAGPQLCWTSTSSQCSLSAYGSLASPGCVTSYDVVNHVRCGLAEAELDTVVIDTPIRYFDVEPPHVDRGEAIDVHFGINPGITCDLDGASVSGTGTLRIIPSGADLTLACPDDVQTLPSIAGPAVGVRENVAYADVRYLSWLARFVDDCRVERDDGSVVVRARPAEEFWPVFISVEEAGPLHLVCVRGDEEFRSDF